MSQSKYWCFTSFSTNPPIFNDLMSYMIVGKEVASTTQREHWQGYVELKKKARMATFKAVIGENAAHCELRKGTGIQAAEYCKKEGNYTEHGSLWQPEPGKRTDIGNAVAMVHSKKRMREIGNELGTTFVKYHKGLAALAGILAEPRKHMTKGYYLVGQTGTGKTAYVYDKHGFEDVYIKDPKTKWWDGYEGQKTVVIDEYRGFENKSDIKLSDILRWCDRYPCQVEIKGAYVNFAPDFIYITSNSPPDAWFPGENLAAFFRRFIEIQESVFTTVCQNWVEE